MLRKMVVPGEKLVEEEPEESEDTDTASIGDIGESLSSDSNILSPLLHGHTRESPDFPSPAHTRSSGKAKMTKDRGPFYKFSKGEGVVYLPGDVNGLAKKLQLLAAEFFAGITPQSGTNWFMYWTHCLD